MLGGIKAAADGNSPDTCKRLAHACTLIMFELNIEDEQDPELAPDDEGE